MGLLSSKKTTIQSDLNSFNEANITVNPTTQIGINLDNSATANAIGKGFAALENAGETFARLLGGGISQSGSAIGGGIQGAGTNIAFALLAGASLYALTRST